MHNVNNFIEYYRQRDQKMSESISNYCTSIGQILTPLAQRINYFQERLAHRENMHRNQIGTLQRNHQQLLSNVENDLEPHFSKLSELTL